MKKRLSLRTEQLVELTPDELRTAAGAAADSFTGRIDCALSLREPCVSAICVRTLAEATWVCTT